jgi:hypothetical protein
MPLAFVQVAVVEVVIVVWLVAAIILLQFVLIPMFDAQYGSGKKSWWKRIVFYPVYRLQTSIRNLVKRIKAILSHQFVNASPPVARWLHNQAQVLEQLSGVVVASNQATYKALGTLRQTTIPTLIERAVAPVRQRVNNLVTRVGVIEDRDRRLSVAIGNMLRGLPWGVGGDYLPNFSQWLNSYDHLWDYVFKTVTNRLNQIRTEYLPDIWRRLERLETQVTTIREEALPAIRQRIGRIEDALGNLLADPQVWLLALIGTLLVPALAPAVVRSRLNSLFCRNTSRVAERVCSLDEQLLQQLLAGTLLFALVLDPRAVIRAGQEVEGAISGGVRAMAGL